MAVYGNITADQGSYFGATVTINDVDGEVLDLTNYTIGAQARKSYKSITGHSFDVTVTDAVNGEILLTMTAAKTAELGGRYLYDIEITDPAGRIFRVIEGQYTVSPGVTR